ncbi:MAG: Lrp/AsnC family transcriptional regulator [Burkholderiales bacterium]|nr:Lrp/AsnC family transcriptional regulator [Burkholderiales bacterium]
MAKDANPVRPDTPSAARLDATDRMLLALLAQDSARSYAELGAALHLSPPAVYERVKRLKREQVIMATVARLDGTKLGRPLLCFIQVITSTIARTRQVAVLSSLPEIEEVHTVTGESGILLKVRTRDAKALEDLLAKIHASGAGAESAFALRG